MALTGVAIAGLVASRPLWSDGIGRPPPLPSPLPPALAAAEAPAGVTATPAPGVAAAAGAAASPASGATPATPRGPSPGRPGGLGAPAVASHALGGIPPAPTADPTGALLVAEAPDRDLVDLAQRMGRTSGEAPRALDAAPPPRAVGDRETFWVHDIVAQRYFTVTATLQDMTAVAYFWVQDGYDFDPEALARGAETFSAQVYPVLRRVFGHEWSPGVDADPRLHVLHHQPIRGVAGYYSSADEYTPPVDPHSNVREMFYVNIDVYEPGSYDWLSLLAHEFQHMIHWRADPNEAVWLNEGFAELATTVAGYTTSSAGQFFSQPDTPLLEWNLDPGKNGPDYAAAFAFSTYLMGRFGEEGIGAIVAQPANGPAGIEAGLAAVGQATPFDDLFLDWVVANVVDDPTVDGGRFSYRDLPMGPVRPGDLAAAAANTVAPYATDYFDATPAVVGGRLDLRLEGEATSGLLEAVPEGDGVVWWSRRGDGIDSRLTRTFDLTGTTEPRLTFRLWYALEPNWDFGYFLVSTDDGATWHRLATARTTDADPNGNNYGAGLTGMSSSWLDETLDLTPYAGQRVTLRFEVITDDAVNLEGMALDDLRLDAIGFVDEANADAGWLAEGWMRTAPVVANRWAVQVIVVDAGGLARVVRPAVSPAGSADIVVDGIGDTARVIVAVSNLTPATRHSAGYSLFSSTD